MIAFRMSVFGAALLACALSACSSTPATQHPLVEAEFQRLFDNASDPGNAFQEDRNFTELLARTDLSLDHRLKVLNARAVGRSTVGENKEGAIADYEEVLRLAPPDFPALTRVREDLDYVRQQKRYIEDRLNGRARTDNNQRFQDLLSLGRHDEAVAFMRQANLKPHAAYIEKLAKLGFLCEGPGYAGTSYQWGASATGLHTVYWCTP